MGIRGIRLAGVSVVTATLLIGAAAGTAGAVSACESLNRRSNFAARWMDAAMDDGDFGSWSRAYTLWLGIETQLQENGC